MSKQTKKSSGKKNSTPKRQSNVELNQHKSNNIYIPSEEDKKMIKKIQHIYHSDEGGTVTLHYESERFDLKTNKNYKSKWKQTFPITSYMFDYEGQKLERIFLKVFLTIKGIAKDRRANYFTIN